MRADVTCRREGESQHELRYSFIAAGTSVGSVRLDRQSTRGVVALRPEFDRAAVTDGRAVEALRSLRDALLVESTVDTIVVAVAPGDEAAIALFVDAGYVGPIWDAQAHAWSYELPLGVWRRVHAGERRTYVVACRTGRLSEHLDRRRNAFPGNLIEVQDKNALAALDLASLAPRYLFFPHWSARVPDAMVEGWECVCFHGTDVPFGRGGSPDSKPHSSGRSNQ